MPQRMLVPASLWLPNCLWVLSSGRRFPCSPLQRVQGKSTGLMDSSRQSLGTPAWNCTNSWTQSLPKTDCQCQNKRKKEKEVLNTASLIHHHLLNNAHENRQPRNNVEELSMLHHDLRAWQLLPESDWRQRPAVSGDWGHFCTVRWSVLCNRTACRVRSLLTSQIQIFSMHLNELQVRNSYQQTETFFRNTVCSEAMDTSGQVLIFQTRYSAAGPNLVSPSVLWQHHDCAAQNPHLAVLVLP